MIISELLYKESKVIEIKSGNNHSFCFYFYTDLLIVLENSDVLNYSYSLDLIKEIDKKCEENENKINQLLMAKICVNLIDGFPSTNEYKDEYEEEINAIKEKKEKIIQENLQHLENIGFTINDEDIYDNQIDQIYANIIKSLIKNNKFENYDLIMNIMKELDMENIPITETIYKELKDILSKEEFYQEYKILTKEDFYIEKKINFYYIFLKYILKNPLYIYDLDFFLDTKKVILNLIRAKENVKINNEKMNYVIKTLADSDYYFKNELKLKEQLKTILEYYKEILFESKKDDIILIEDIIKNNKNFGDDLLKDYEKAKLMKIKLPVIKYIFENENKSKKEKEMKKVVEKWEKLEKLIRDKKTAKMKANERKMIYNYFKDNNNKSIFLQIFKEQQIYDDFIIKANEFYGQNNLKQDDKEKKEIEKGEIIQEKKEIEKGDKKEEIKIEIKNGIKEEIKEDFDKEKGVKSSLTEIGKDNINIYQKPKENDNSKIENSNSLCDESTMSNTFDFFQTSIDLKAAEPSFKQDLQINNKLDIPNFISKKFTAVLYSRMKGTEPYLIYDEIQYGNNALEIDYNRFMKFKEDLFLTKGNNNKVYKNLKKFFEYLNEIEKRFIEEFENEYMIKIKLILIREEGKDNSNGIYNITAYYFFCEPSTQKLLKYRDANVLINKTNTNLQGFQFMLYNMNCQKYNYIKYSTEYFQKVINFIDNDDKDNNIIIKINSQYEKCASKYSIIEYIKTIGKTKYSADYIKALSNGYYIVGSQNILYIYDNQLVEKPNLAIKCKDWVYSTCERILHKANNKNKNIQVICCMNSSIGLVEITEKISYLTLIEMNLKSNLKKRTKKDRARNTYNICFEMRENNYLMAGLHGAIYYINFFGNKTEVEQIKVSEKTYKGGIKLNENIVVLSSNSVIPEGEDKLIFFNSKTKKITEGNNKYSFAVNEHNMSLMNIGKKNCNDKILLCACKKYLEDQKNGILLVNPQLGENENIINPFYDTGYFEVYCFCPIFSVINNNENILKESVDEDYKKNIEVIDTNYFFVGGYDQLKRKGGIKLYKIISGDKTANTKIKFLQNIEFDNNNFEGISEQIKCMIQSKITGNIIVTCANGNIFLFTKPNLELYINENT